MHRDDFGILATQLGAHYKLEHKDSCAALQHVLTQFKETLSRKMHSAII